MNDTENKESSNNKTLEVFLQFATEIVKSEEISKFLSEYNDRKLRESENNNITQQKIASFNTAFQEKHNERYFKFHKNKMIKESIIIFLLLATIVTLSLCNQMEKSTTGTLIGSIIGYAIGNMTNFINGKENQR